MLLSAHSQPRMSIQRIYPGIDRMLRSGTFLHLVLATLLLYAPIIILGNLPFQSITATIAAAVLGLFFPLEQIGTILMIGDLEIAITKDCSGLGTASALIPCALIWCLVSNKNLFITMVLIYPALLIANTIRVVSITLIAYFFDIELAMGVLHDLTGLAVFATALSTIALLQSNSLTLRIKNLELERIFAILILTLSTTYMMIALVTTQLSSPLDRISLPLLAFGLLSAFLSKPFFDHKILKLNHNMLLTFGLFLLGLFLDFNAIVNVSVVFFIFFGFNQIAKNKIWWSACFACALAGLPGVPYTLSTMLDGWNPSIVQYLLAFLLLPFLIGLRAFSKLTIIDKVARPASVLLLMLVTLLIGLSSFVDRTANVDQINIPYIFNGWVGHDVPLTLNEERLFQHGSVVKRTYQRAGDKVWLLHLQTSDRRSIHLPQYCYLTGGWKINEAGINDNENSDNVLGEFIASKPNQHRRVKYWFDFSGEAFSKSTAFILYKMQLMIRGGAENWQFYRISSDDYDSDRQQHAFIKDLRTIIGS